MIDYSIFTFNSIVQIQHPAVELVLRLGYGASFNSIVQILSRRVHVYTSETLTTFNSIVQILCVDVG